MALRRQYLVLILILALAAFLRFTGLDWDDYLHYHPDERYISWVATTIEAPDRWQDAFSPHRSSFNPFYWPAGAHSAGIVVPQDEQRDFAYGHLPLYLGVAATRLAEDVGAALANVLPPGWLLTRDLLNAGDFIEFRHLTAVSRALTALFDVATVLLVFLLARRVFNPPIALVAAAFLAVNVMHIQLARFFAVDPYLTFFVVAAIYCAVRLVQAKNDRQLWLNALATGLFIGCAVGSKFSAVMLFLPFIVALYMHDDASTGKKRRLFAGATLLSGAVFAISNPFALLDWTCDLVTPAVQLGSVRLPALNWGSCYLDNVLRQSLMVRGEGTFDFTRQYTGTLPYFYPMLMQMRWGMGYLLALPAFAGFGWAVWRMFMPAVRSKTANMRSRIPPAMRPQLIMLAWAVPYFLVTGSFFVKFMRYMQPLTPFLMIYAAALLLMALKKRQGLAVVTIVFAGTLVYALAFINMYREEHPWNETSRWMYANVQPGALIATELWDDPLPSSMVIDGEAYSRHLYDYTELTWLREAGSADDAQKLLENLERVAASDYLVLSSNRVYGVVSRLEHLYPLSSQYYRQLFSGDLGFEVVSVAHRSPQLGAFSFAPDPFAGTQLPLPESVRDYLAQNVGYLAGKADESFTVYDQPFTIIFRNQQRLSVEEMMRSFAIP